MEKVYRNFFTIIVATVVVILGIYKADSRFILNNRLGSFYDFIYQIDVINQHFINDFVVYDMTDIVKQTDRKMLMPEFIIIHHDTYPYIDNSWNSVNELHDKERGWGGIQYHYFISKSGRIYKNHTENNVTIHSGTTEMNHKSIAVCIQGNFDTEFLMGEQKTALSKLLHSLKKKYRTIKIIAHRDVKETSCPGKNIDISDLIELSYKPHKLLVK